MKEIGISFPQINYAKLNRSLTVLRSLWPSVCVTTQGRVPELSSRGLISS